jgi:hypothetical protein
MTLNAAPVGKRAYGRNAPAKSTKQAANIGLGEAAKLPLPGTRETSAP